jgi:hypothetical protein
MQEPPRRARLWPGRLSYLSGWEAAIRLALSAASRGLVCGAALFCPSAGPSPKEGAL